jgi:hypothetical protein
VDEKVDIPPSGEKRRGRTIAGHSFDPVETRVIGHLNAILGVAVHFAGAAEPTRHALAVGQEDCIDGRALRDCACRDG